MSIENDILESLEFNDVISRFALKKLANIACMGTTHHSIIKDYNVLFLNIKYCLLNQ